MESSDSRLKEMLSNVSDWLNEQEWFQQLKAKWEELDPQSRLYAKAGGLAAGLLCLLLIVLSAVWSVHSLKNEVSDRQALLAQIQSANEELHRLREETAAAPQAAAQGGTGPWPAYVESVGASAGVDKSSFTVANEKAGTSSDQAKETLFDVALKHVSIKQVVRLAFGLENGARPVKLRNLSIDTHADPQGYLDATLALSGFALITK